MIHETITFKFVDAEQQRRFHERLAGSDIERIAELEAALRPFAACVFNDNGDVTISTGHLKTDDYMRAKSASK